MKKQFWLSGVVAFLCSTSASADSSPNSEKQVFWGDTHLHTRLSADAYMSGTVNFTPADAYRFAKGEPVTSSSGVAATLDRPLDFLVVADHSEFLGLFALADEGDRTFLSTQLGKRWGKYAVEKNIPAMFREFQNMMMGDGSDESTPLVKQYVWDSVVETADAFNDPGQFTALVGYEWSSTPQSSNLHRIVIYRDGVGVADQMPPFSAVDSENPVDLWSFMSGYEEKTGGRILAIPHNGNLSNGLMFSDLDFDGNLLTKEYAQQRNRWEPVYEVTQIKGDGETHPSLSPDDGFADYETWDTGNFPVGEGARVKEPWMLQYEYARQGLKQGLKWEEQLGVNPFQFGMIGSTDAHTGLPAIAESNFFGKFPESEPGPKRLTSKMEWLTWPNAMLTASGYAAVWAEKNTRESIFDAFQRREVYASTGPRMVVRVFAGWDFNEGDLTSPDYSERGYQRGVPMGATLFDAPDNHAPRLMITALKDPDGANLDRIQVVKGWLQKPGNKLQEKVFDVALSDGRTVNPQTGQVPLVGNTVDLETATYSNTIGEPMLSVVWEDPQFDPNQHAFYYIRVLEIPTPRWTAYDAEKYAQKAPEGTKMITQERVYTSPIWYRPSDNQKP